MHFQKKKHKASIVLEWSKAPWNGVQVQVNSLKPVPLILTWLNPLRAKFFKGNINIYLHFVSFLHIDTTQVVEILPEIRQEPTYST